MFSKISFLVSCLAVANAGLITPAEYTTYNAPAYTSYSAPTLSATSENVYRSPDNLQSISTQSKSIATPFSSSNKHDVRITNPGVYNHVAPVAPVAPVGYAKYAFDAVPHHTAYATAPGQVAYATAPAQVAYATDPAQVAYAKYGPVPVAHSAHLEHHPHAFAPPSPAVAHGSSLLGVAYSPAVAVSHMTYSSPVGINYSW